MISIDAQKQKITLSVAARIKHLRLTKSMSQEDLALRAEINPAYFGQIERGLKCPTIDTLYKIAKALDMSLSELFRIDTPPMVTVKQDQRLLYLMSKVPEGKQEQVLNILEDLIALL